LFIAETILTKRNVVATTNTIDACHSASGVFQGGSKLLSRIAMRKLGNDGVEERVTLLPVEEILARFVCF